MDIQPIKKESIQMTNAELQFANTGPTFLNRIADATEKIAAEMGKANKWKSLNILVQCGSPEFKQAVMETLGKELGFIKPAEDGDCDKEGGE